MPSLTVALVSASPNFLRAPACLLFLVLLLANATHQSVAADSEPTADLYNNVFNARERRGSHPWQVADSMSGQINPVLVWKGAPETETFPSWKVLKYLFKRRNDAPPPPPGFVGSRGRRGEKSGGVSAQSLYDFLNAARLEELEAQRSQLAAAMPVKESYKKNDPTLVYQNGFLGARG